MKNIKNMKTCVPIQRAGGTPHRHQSVLNPALAVWGKKSITILRADSTLQNQFSIIHVTFSI